MPTFFDVYSFDFTSALIILIAAGHSSPSGQRICIELVLRHVRFACQINYVVVPTKHGSL